MKIIKTDTFNEKCDKILNYLFEISKKDKQVQILTHLNIVSSDLDITTNDPVLHYLSHEKKYVYIDMKNAFTNITSSGIAFISHSSFVKEQLKSETDTKLKWYETENAKQIFDDYPIVKRRTIRSELIAIISIIIATIAVIIQLVTNH